MKYFKTLFIAFIILIIIAGVGGYVFLKTLDINRYKPQIVKAAREALGRELDYEAAQLKVSLSQGVSFNLKQLTVQDIPSYQNDTFLKVGEISLGADILSYVLHKNINISNIKIQSPQISIIRQKDGQMNVQDYGQIGAAVSQQESSTAQPNPAMTLPLIMINSFIVDGGTIKYIDRTFEPELNLKFSKVHFKNQGFSLTKENFFELDAAAFNTQANIHCSGFVKPDIIKQQLLLSRLEITSDLSQVSMEKIRSSLPMLKDIPLPSLLKGKLHSSVNKLTLGAEGLTELKADVEVSDGKAVFNELAPGISLDVDMITFKLNNLTLDEVFTFSFKGAYLSKSPNITATGRGTMDLIKQSVDLTDIEIASDLSSLSMAMLKDSMTALKDVPLPDKAAGSVRMMVSKLSAGSQGLVSLAAEGNLSNGKVDLKELAVPIDAMQAQWRINESKIDVPKIALKIGQGVLEATAAIDDYLTQQRFNVGVDFQGLDFNELIDQSQQSIKLKGKLSGSTKIKGEGFDPDKMLSSLDGEGNLSIKEGKLTDINILKVVLSKLSMIPNLQGVLEANLPQAYKEKLARKDTIITESTVNIMVRDGAVVISPVMIKADNFTFDGKGQAGFDSSYALEGSFYIPEQFSLTMVDHAGELQYLLDEQNRIFIPLKASGKGADVKFSVDAAYLGKKLIQNRGRAEVNKALNKVFNTERTPAPPQEGVEQPNLPEKKEKPVEQQMIEGVLDNLFKKK